MKTTLHQPLVSVLLPVYNAEQYLRASLESILSQTYKNIEVICVDDGSADASFKILRIFAKQDKRVKVYRNRKNQGIGYTANKATSHAKGDFIARMDADDIMLFDRIEKQVHFLQNNPEMALVGGQCLVINEEGKITGEKKNPTAHKDIYKMLFSSMSVQNPTIMINKKLTTKEALTLDPTLHPIDDLDMLFKLLACGRFANLPDFVLQYRVYRGSSTMKDPKKSFLLTLKVRARAIQKYHYKPSLKALLVCLAQAGIVLILPNAAVYALYAHMRGIKRLSFSLPIPNPLIYTKKVALLFLGQ